MGWSLWTMDQPGLVGKDTTPHPTLQNTCSFKYTDVTFIKIDQLLGRKASLHQVKGVK